MKLVFYLIWSKCHSVQMRPFFRFNILPSLVCVVVAFFLLALSPSLSLSLLVSFYFIFDFYICFAMLLQALLCDCLRCSFRFSYNALFRFFSHDSVVFLFDSKAFLFDQLMASPLCTMAGRSVGRFVAATATLTECSFNRTSSVSMIWTDDICLLLIGLYSLHFFLFVVFFFFVLF